MAKKLRLKRPELAETEVEGVEVDVALEVAVDLEETKVAGAVAATLVANTGIWQGIVIEVETVEMATVEMGEEGLAEAEVVVVAEEVDATIVEKMVTWLGIVPNPIAEIVEADNFVTKRKQI